MMRTVAWVIFSVYVWYSDIPGDGNRGRRHVEGGHRPGETRGFLRCDRKGCTRRLAVSLPDTRAHLLAGVDLRGRLPLHERPSTRSGDLGLDPGFIRHRDR